MKPIKNGLNELAQASTIFPKVLDRVDPDKLAERILDSTNFPQSIMRTDAEMEEVRAQQAAELAQAQAQQQLEGMAEAVPKLQKKTEEAKERARETLRKMIDRGAI